MKEFISFMIGIALILTALVAWFNHIFWCFTTQSWGFLIAGAIFFPIGIIHGIWLWFQ